MIVFLNEKKKPKQQQQKILLSVFINCKLRKNWLFQWEVILWGCGIDGSNLLMLQTINKIVQHQSLFLSWFFVVSKKSIAISLQQQLGYAVSILL